MLSIETKNNSIYIRNKLTAILLLAITCAGNGAFADEWKSCEVSNATASQREAAIALGKIEKRISFFKKNDFASIVIFLDGKPGATTDLIPTGRRFYDNGKPYIGYANKANTFVIQESEDSDTMIVTVRGDITITMFAKCK